jgi:predicted lipoprotein with Yx(FWY)xxD motif
LSTTYKLGCLTLATVVFALTLTSASSDEYTVGIKYDMDLGSYLVNGTGMTLYYHEGDSPGTSELTSYDDWTPFWVKGEIKEVGRGLNSGDFSTINIKTDDGDKKQVTYKDWPLYLYDEDKDPGDINGNGENSGVGINKMYVVDPTDFHPE